MRHSAIRLSTHDETITVHTRLSDLEEILIDSSTDFENGTESDEYWPSGDSTHSKFKHHELNDLTRYFNFD